MKTLTLKIDEQFITVDEGTAFREVLPRTINGLNVIGVRVNNEICSLGECVRFNATLEALSVDHCDGWRIMRQTLCLLLAQSINSYRPGISFRIRNALGAGIYVTIEWTRDDLALSLETHIKAIKQRMKEVIASNLPIVHERVSYCEAIDLLTSTQQTDKLLLLKHRNPPSIDLIRVKDFYDLAIEPVADSTGAFSIFDLVPHDNHFVLLLPTQSQSTILPKFTSVITKLDRVFAEHREWGKYIGMTSVGHLNEAIVSGAIHDVVQTTEAFHDKKLAEIASEIALRGMENSNNQIRLVLLAGPSSSGKTTSAMRLCTHLRVNGLSPCLISTDNYFVGDALNPRDEEGKLDYEHIEAMDLERMDYDLCALLEGKSVQLRTFDFKRKEGYDRSEEVSLPKNGIVVMEGIHCLNPRLAPTVATESKFKVFVSALTQMGIDRNHRISTADNRLIRRLVRDYAHRGRSAHTTLSLWENVRKGEEKWIFPFQNQADAMFNTSLDYELAVLKSYAVPLLHEIKPTDVLYSDVRRLSGMLLHFLTLPSNIVPSYSILRETIGGSKLQY